MSVSESIAALHSHRVQYCGDPCDQSAGRVSPVSERDAFVHVAGTVHVTVPSTARPAPVSVASVSEMSAQAPPFQYFTVRLLAVPFGPVLTSMLTPRNGRSAPTYMKPSPVMAKESIATSVVSPSCISAEMSVTLTPASTV